MDCMNISIQTDSWPTTKTFEATHHNYYFLWFSSSAQLSSGFVPGSMPVKSGFICLGNAFFFELVSHRAFFILMNIQWRLNQTKFIAFPYMYNIPRKWLLLLLFRFDFWTLNISKKKILRHFLSFLNL